MKKVLLHRYLLEYSQEVQGENIVISPVLWTIHISLREVKEFAQGHSTTLGNVWKVPREPGSRTQVLSLFLTSSNLTPYFDWSRVGKLKILNHLAVLEHSRSETKASLALKKQKGDSQRRSQERCLSLGDTKSRRAPEAGVWGSVSHVD